MANIQSSTAGIRRGEKEERMKKPRSKNIMATITSPRQYYMNGNSSISDINKEVC